MAGVCLTRMWAVDLPGASGTSWLMLPVKLTSRTGAGENWRYFNAGCAFIDAIIAVHSTIQIGPSAAKNLILPTVCIQFERGENVVRI